ncbi:MAG: hypothetical protein ARM1_0553 [Candidatus Micrarchaeota archaeon]|nr:MAG: hypothetical protein ARM1_0553 [Candidatus Micrarchaeota archaeon]
MSCLEDVEYWKIGRVNIKEKAIEIDEDAFNRFASRNSRTLKCDSCHVRCGRGCTHSSFINSKRLDVPGDYPGKCDILRNILYNYLNRKLSGLNEYQS